MTADLLQIRFTGPARSLRASRIFDALQMWEIGLLAVEATIELFVEADILSTR